MGALKPVISLHVQYVDIAEVLKSLFFQDHGQSTTSEAAW